jgi:formamidopyrimidine-DNA glycosylase
MPELPDIAAYVAALEPRILGKPLERVRLNGVSLLRTASPPIAEAEGRTVRDLRRVGKRIAIGLEGDLWLVLHLMIAGRLHWRAPHAKLGGRNMLAALDFADGTLVLTEAGSKRRASLHVVAGQGSLDAVDRGGIDVLNSDLNAFVRAMNAENHTLKRALTDPRIIDGIGNAYSDEILHAAKLSPTAMTQKLRPDEWERLFAATRSTLQMWMQRLSDRVEHEFPEGVTAFREGMAVHGRYGKACPQCGDTIRRIRYADNETNYCATCQTGGKVLADRALSRLGIDPSRGSREGRRIVAFYEGAAPDDRGRRLGDVLEFHDDQLEEVHDFIQWLFPLPERSGANPSAPVLDAAAIDAFHARPELRAALRTSLDRMLAFYGFGWNGDLIVKTPAFALRSGWLSAGNHNHLRLTRILRSLAVLGEPRAAQALLRILEQLYEEERATGRNRISGTTLTFWRNAIPRYHTGGA